MEDEDRKSRIILDSPEEFFHAALGKAMSRVPISVSPYVHAYLTKMLVRLSIDIRCHPEEMLSPLFLEAKLQGGFQGALKMSVVGDRALVCCGLWWERQYRLRRPFDTKYHITLGRTAYRAVGGEVFRELSAKFERLAETLAELSVARVLFTDQELVHLFELYNRTRCTLAARVLIRQGLTPETRCSKTPS